MCQHTRYVHFLVIWWVESPHPLIALHPSQLIFLLSCLQSLETLQCPVYTIFVNLPQKPVHEVNVKATVFKQLYLHFCKLHKFNERLVIKLSQQNCFKVPMSLIQRQLRLVKLNHTGRYVSFKNPTFFLILCLLLIQVCT